MNVYELINPSDHIEFRAASDDIAALAALIVGEGKTPAERVDTGEQVCPFFLFEDPAPWLAERFGSDDFGAVLRDRSVEISKALSSFVCGRWSELDGLLTHVPDTERDAFVLTYSDNNRSSMNDFAGYARSIKFKEGK